jgi:hypothetical protein
MYNYCRNHQCSYLNELHKLEPRKEITKKQHWWQVFSPSEEFQLVESELGHQCVNCDSFIRNDYIEDYNLKLKKLLEILCVHIKCQICGNVLEFTYETGYKGDLYCRSCKNYAVATHSLKRLLGGI